MDIIHEVAEDWLKDFPHLKAPVEKVEMSMHGIKNTRRKMEDRYALCLDLNSLFMLEASLCSPTIRWCAPSGKCESE